jgi:hypothetical protein
MHRSVVALFSIIFVVDIHEAFLKTPASINKDAIEMAQLAEKLWSFKPDILNHARNLTYCPIIDQCCDEEDRSEAISLMNPFEYRALTDDLENVMERCMNTTKSNKKKTVMFNNSRINCSRMDGS